MDTCDSDDWFVIGDSVKELQCRRYPPDGDVQRWVDQGPTGHVNYEGGPVEWEPHEETTSGVVVGSSPDVCVGDVQV